MGQEPIRRVTVLTGDAGFGHRRSANAIAQALTECYGEDCAVEIINPLDDKRVMSLLRKTQGGHDHCARSWRGIYDLAWQATRSTVGGAAIGGSLAVMLYQVMHDIVCRRRPDIIITTYPLYHPALSAVFAASRRRVPLVTVVTDLGPVHPVWYSKDADACLVATPMAKAQALAHGLAAERVHVTGIPVDLAVARGGRDRLALRNDLGWQPDLPTLLAVGSRRVTGLPEVLEEINASGLSLQLVVVAGGDGELHRRMTAVEWRMPAHLYLWSDHVPDLLRASDCVITKAGGLIIAEALACGTPLIITEVMPDQERGNAAVVVQSGAGELAVGPGKVVGVVTRWLAQDGRLLAEHARHAQDLGHPRAAYAVAEHVWALLEGARQGVATPAL
jgi:UDP-N-acetylglucosamine:LPS N-acetylglucosamine transferase